MRVSRRQFFGLAGAAAAAAAIPKPLLALEIPPAEVEVALTAAGWFDNPPAKYVLGVSVYSLPYWNVADHSGYHFGIERSSKP